MTQDDHSTGKDVKLLKELLQNRRAGSFISDAEGRTRTLDMIARKRQRFADKDQQFEFRFGE